MVSLPLLPRFNCCDLHRLNESQRPMEELYDVRPDPDQVKNLAADPRQAAVKDRLWNELRASLEKTSAYKPQ